MENPGLYLQQDVAQDNRIVAGLVTRCVDKRERTLPRQSAQFLKLYRPLTEFRRIALAKLWPPGGVVSEPFSKLGAGREILDP